MASRISEVRRDATRERLRRSGSTEREGLEHTSSTSHPPKLTPRTFCEPYGKLGLMGLSASTAGTKVATRRVTEESKALKETMVVAEEARQGSGGRKRVLSRTRRRRTECGVGLSSLGWTEIISSKT